VTYAYMAFETTKRNGQTAAHRGLPEVWHADPTAHPGALHLLHDRAAREDGSATRQEEEMTNGEKLERLQEILELIKGPGRLVSVHHENHLLFLPGGGKLNKHLVVVQFEQLEEA